MSRWPKYLVFLVVGYLSMTRAFAYLGLPPLKLFIGELSIAAFLFSKPRAVFDRWLQALAQPGPLSGFAVAFTAFILYGVFEVVRGINFGYPPMIALQSFAFHYYPVCFFIGLWAGMERPDLLHRTLRVLAWANGIYGLLWILILNRFLMPVPGTYDVPLFGQPGGAAIVILGLLCFEPRLSRVWPLLLINVLVMLGLLVRAEWLGFILGALLWATLTRQLGRIAMAFGAVVVLLLIGFATDFRMPAPSSRGGEISARGIVGRVVAPVNSDLAAEYTAEEDARSQAGTTTWRTRWWKEIWKTVHESTETAVFGEGYGYPLAQLVGYTQRDIRTPHSVFFYTLAYGGWVGVVVFLSLQAAVLHLLWRAWRITGNPFGLAFWLSFFAGALFGNVYETPFGAIPFYLLTGLAAVPAMMESRTYARPLGSQLLSATRW